MNFESIARKACDRQDYVRAVVTLSRGLKRLDDVDCEAFDLLIDLYANCCDAPGLEREIGDVLVRHFDAGLISGQIIACLEARELFSMSRAFRREMSSRGVLIEDVSLESLTHPPEAPIPFEPEPEYEEPVSEPHLSPLSPTPEDAHSPVESTQEDHDASSLELPVVEGEDDLAEPDPPEAFDEEEPPEEFASPREIEWTDEQDREPDTPPAYTPVSPRHDEHSPEPVAPARRSWRWIVALVIVILALVGVVLVFSPPSGARVQALEQQLEAFDTINPTAFELLLDTPDEELDPEAQARMDFARMLLALERGEVLPAMRTASQDDVWARGAAVFHALQRRDVEAALAHVEAMERRWPDELATLWTRARLEEERGRFADARRAYELALHRWPRFLPGLMGAVRVAFYQGSAQSLDQAQADLRELNPLHPYLSIQSDPLQRALTRAAEAPPLDSVEVANKSTLSEQSPDRFARAYNAYLNAHLLRDRGDLSAAHAQARDALSLSPHMSPALLLQGVILAAQLRVDDAGQVFARYAALEQLDVQARLALMVYAPRALTRAGRPDLALLFALDPGGESARSKLIQARGEPLLSQQQQWRPIALNLTREQREAHAASSQLALAELIWALLDLGAAQEALQLTRQLSAESYPFLDDLQWFAYKVMGAAQRLTDLAYQNREATTSAYPDLLAALANFELMQAHRLVLKHPDIARRQMLWLRSATRARLVASSRQDVLANLDRLEYVALPGELSRQRMLVWTMLEPGNKKATELREAQLTSETTSLHALLDLAHTALWQPDLEAAERYMARARALAPEHDEVVYLDAIMMALRDDEKGLRELFKRSALSDVDPVWLLDVGELAIRHRRTAIAHDRFTQLKRSSQSLSPELIDRLGRVLVTLESKKALQILTTLEARAQGKEQRTERSKLLRWMAVVSGVREGKKEGDVLLDRALGLEDVPQDELWLEKGRFFVANAQKKRARDSFNQALRYNSSLAQAHAELGELALTSERPDQAREYFIKYLEARPYGATSSVIRQKLDQLQGDNRPPIQDQENPTP